MKMLKRILAAAAVFMVASVAAFAEADVAVGELGSMKRADFTKEVASLSEDDVADILAGLFEEDGLVVTFFEPVGEVTDEAADIYGEIMDEVAKAGKKNYAYVGAGVIGEGDYDDYDDYDYDDDDDYDYDDDDDDYDDGEAVAGYIVFAHFVSKKDTTAMMYYFEVEFDD